MPKEVYEQLRSELRKQGIKVRIVNGQVALEKSSIASSIRKPRNISFIAKRRPPGTPGRTPPDGYNLQGSVHMNNADYDLVYDTCKTIIDRTPSIDKDQGISNQPDKEAIGHCINQLLEVFPELHAYDQYGRWAPRAFFQLILKTKSGKARTTERTAKATQQASLVGPSEDGQVPVPVAIPEDKPRRPKGRPRRAKVHADAPPIAQLPVPLTNPALVVPPVAFVQPAQPNVHQLAPSAVNQLAPPVAGQPIPLAGFHQPAPAVLFQPSPPIIEHTALSVIGEPGVAFVPQSRPPARCSPVGLAGDKEEGEYIDMDMSLFATVKELSRMSLTVDEIMGNSTAIVADDSDDDGGGFDMAQVNGSSLIPPPDIFCNSTSAPSTAAPELSPPISAPALRSSPRKRATAQVAPPPPAPNPASSVVVSDNDPAPKPRPRRTPTTPFMSAPIPMSAPNPLPVPNSVSAPDSFPAVAVMWRGILVGPGEYAAIQSAAAQQAKTGVPANQSPMFKDLIDNLAADPAYDPSSEPIPDPEPPIPAPTRGRGRGRGGRGRGRGGSRAGAASAVIAPAGVLDPVAPASTLSDLEVPKAIAKAKVKPKPKPKPAPEPEPEPEPEFEPEPVNNNRDATGEEDRVDNAQTDVAMEEGLSSTAAKRGKGKQTAARKGGKKAPAKAKSQAAIADASAAPVAPIAPDALDVPDIPVTQPRRTARVTRSTLAAKAK